MNEILTWLLDTVQSVDPVVRTLLAGVAIMLETSVLVGLVVPGDTVVLVAGSAVDGLGQGVALVVTVVIGALIGESIGFWLGRWVGPKLRHSRVGKLLGEKNWQRAELYLQRRGGIAIFISRFLPVLHSLVPLTVGMSGYRYGKFLAWTAPASLLWTVLYVSVSAYAADTFRDSKGTVQIAGYLFVGTILLFLFAMWLVKKWLDRAEKRRMEPETDPVAPAVAVQD